MARKLDAQKSGFRTSSSSSSSAAGGPRKRPAPSSSSSSSDFGAHSSGGNNAFQLVQQSLKKARMRSKNEQAIAANREASHPRSAAHAPIDKTAQVNHLVRWSWPFSTNLLKYFYRTIRYLSCTNTADDSIGRNLRSRPFRKTFWTSTRHSRYVENFSAISRLSTTVTY